MSKPSFPFDPPQAENEIHFHLEEVDFDLPMPEPELKKRLLAVAAGEHKPVSELTIVFLSDEALLDMNREFLDHDYYTDILTFPLDGPALAGDIFISIDRVWENAVAFGATFEQELCRVMIHGVLHLAGYGDGTEDEKRQMRAKEDEYLELFYPNTP